MNEIPGSHKINDLGKRLSPYFLLLLIVVFGFWQVSFLFRALKWDMIDVVFPFRFYFSECIRSGYFPFWNPYLQTGTPFFADLQAPTYYPELLFTSLFGGYGIYTMHFWFTVYLFLAAAGMFQLSYLFNQNRLASFLAAFSYAFSGFVVGHGQHFFLLVGVAWIPFVIKNYLELLQKGGMIQVIKTAVFVFLMVTGAYQALSITLFYLLAVLFIWFIIKEITQKNRARVFRIIKENLFLFLVVLILLLPLVFSTLEVLTSVDRLSNGIDAGKIAQYGQSLRTLISFLVPFSTLKFDYFGNIDTCMIDHYFGLVTFLFLGLALFRKRTGIEYLIFIFGGIIFASSFRDLPVRDFMFRFVPFMNLFKYAAYIRIFGLLAFILLAANYFSFLQQNFEKERKRILITGVLLLAVLLFFIFYSFGKTSPAEIKNTFAQKSWGEILAAMPVSQLVFFQAVFQSVLLLVFLALIFFHKKIRHLFQLVVVLLVVDMFAATQLNMFVSVVDPVRKPVHMKKDLALFPEKFPIPVNNKIIYNDNQHVIFPPFWRNTSVFSKEISFYSFSSFELNSFNKLDDDYPNLRNAVLNNRLFYFSDTIFPLSQFDDNKVNSETCSEWLYFQDDIFDVLSEKAAKTDSSDTGIIKEFSPNKITLETVTKNDQFLTLLQTNFKGWKAFIDNVETPVYTSNFNYRTVFLPGGTHTIRFEYKNNKVLFLNIFSNVVFVFLVLFLVVYYLRRKNGQVGWFYLWIPGVFLVVALSLLARNFSHRNENKSVYEIYNERWFEEKPLYNVGKNFDGNETTILPENEFFLISKIDPDSLKLKNGTLVVTAEIKPAENMEGLLVSDIHGSGIADGWHASKIEKQIEKTGEWNKVIYFRNLYDLKKDNTVDVYIWNLKKCSFEIKNMEVNIYPLIH